MRKSLEERNSEKISVWITPELLKRLEKKAIKEKRSLSFIIREAIELLLKPTSNP